MTTLQYQIFTEHKNLYGIREILDRYMPGYTIFYGAGVWKKQHEPSLIIIAMEVSAEDVYSAVAEIKALNNQQSVWVASCEVQLQAC